MPDIREEFEAWMIDRFATDMGEHTAGISMDTLEAISREMWLRKVDGEYQAVVPREMWAAWQASRVALKLEQRKNGQWIVRIICCQCGKEHNLSRYSASLAKTLNECCTGCGTRGEFIEIVSRWISSDTWWKPWTWGNGHWEDF